MHEDSSRLLKAAAGVALVAVSVMIMGLYGALQCLRCELVIQQVATRIIASLSASSSAIERGYADRPPESVPLRIQSPRKASNTSPSAPPPVTRRSPPRPTAVSSVRPISRITNICLNTAPQSSGRSTRAAVLDTIDHGGSTRLVILRSQS